MGGDSTGRSGDVLSVSEFPRRPWACLLFFARVAADTVHGICRLPTLTPSLAFEPTCDGCDDIVIVRCQHLQDHHHDMGKLSNSGRDGS